MTSVAFQKAMQNLGGFGSKFSVIGDTANVILSKDTSICSYISLKIYSIISFLSLNCSYIYFPTHHYTHFADMDMTSLEARELWTRMS